jgi:uncharacterized Zn-binding protein involved in type VI secretion
MAALAKKDGESAVECTDGKIGDSCGVNKNKWNKDSVQESAAGSSDVLVNGIGTVRKDDKMASHPNGKPCVSEKSNHEPTLSTYSSTVFANGKNIGRVNDVYNLEIDDSETKETLFDHKITTGSDNVFAG